MSVIDSDVSAPGSDAVQPHARGQVPVSQPGNGTLMASAHSADRLEILSMNVAPAADTALPLRDNFRIWRGKRVFDIAGALVAALIFSPVLLAIVLRLSVSGGSIIFSQKRVGRNGRLFACYKFQTMRPDAEQILEELLRSDPEKRAEWERDYKLRDDPRVTKFGRFLRKTSFDELPQLWNILKGDMSLVGPRPIVSKEMDYYGSNLGHYLSVRPGVTGLWQISGRNDTGYPDRVILDRAYVLSSCLSVDIGIVLRTLTVVLSRSGAY